MIEVPAMFDCPTCGLPIEEGSGPGGLAWHDCTFVMALTQMQTEDPDADPWDTLVRSVVGAVKERAATMPPRDLAELLAAAASRKVAAQGGGISDALRDFLNEEIPDDDPCADPEPLDGR